ncbi:MAG TPA: hypothetical protein VLJ61_00395 [Pyrinomonadaceae bacterium]|nr:hypothetical protein [Pyrinomonadaceae bacterium]
MNRNSRDIEEVRRAGEEYLAETASACPACGARARRDDARYCSTCGRALGEDYFPTDSLRASYRFGSLSAPQRPRLTREPKHAKTRMSRRARASLRVEVMPRNNRSGVSATAFAFVTYALVPYLGILFCPGALLLGGIGLMRSRHAHTRRDSALSFALGLVILCAQLLLWWILYKVPEWSRRAPF